MAPVAIVGIGKPQASDETDDEDQPRERTRVSHGKESRSRRPARARKRLGCVSSIMGVFPPSAKVLRA
jgi:hypothetical protein